MTRSIKCIMVFSSDAAINLKFTDSKEQIQPELTPLASNQDKSEDSILHDSRKEDQGQTGTRTWWLYVLIQAYTVWNVKGLYMTH